MSALDLALSRTRGMLSSVAGVAELIRKAPGFSVDSLVSPTQQGAFSFFRDDSATKRRYSNFRGVVYAAVNALASEGASQPVQIGKSKTTSKKKKLKPTKFLTLGVKAMFPNFEPIEGHDLESLLEKPNPLQHRYQFVYSFIANLCLTGWAYIVKGESEDGKLELYSLPTNWVKPDHTDGLFSKFYIINPESPNTKDAPPLTREQVAFAYLPDPSNPMNGYAPATSQIPAIKIDEAIQSSQMAFFDNGIFPSVIVTVGQQPHPDVPGGLRPRLSPQQRRQVYSAIKKASSGVANYGDPIIVDGLIEKIERLSATQNEMGWEKSEKSVRSRILSAFGVHPFILGEEVATSYAQSAVVDMRFGKKLNVFLSLLSTVVSEFVPNIDESYQDVKVIWTPYEPNDPGMKDKQWSEARKNGDVSQAEYRAYMGLPPDPDAVEAAFDKATAQMVMQLAEKVKGGAIDREQAIGILKGLGVKDDLAEEIVGDGVSDQQAIDELGSALDGLDAAGGGDGGWDQSSDFTA